MSVKKRRIKSNKSNYFSFFHFLRPLLPEVEVNVDTAEVGAA